MAGAGPTNRTVWPCRLTDLAIHAETPASFLFVGPPRASYGRLRRFGHAQL